MKAKGITLAKLSCLAKCNGAHVSLYYGAQTSLETFRDSVISVCKGCVPQQVIIASYSRPVLNQSGAGHFSPIGGYNMRSDMVLIMDVARFKYPPHWL